jgi:hypothetical protein
MSDAITLDSAENPFWVLELPDAIEIEPPPNTLEQELPFGKLSWQNFERLCRRLAGMDGDAEYCRLYGTEGQEQGGVDIYVRRRSSTKYATWQSKRYKSFGPAQVEAAVVEFFDGEWATKSDRFVLCVQATLRSKDIENTIEESAQRLRAAGIEFLPLDGVELSERLKEYPQIVYDFFGFAWVERFCGRAATESVAKRLTPSEFRRLKGQLLACYASHFSSVDPSVLSLLAAPGGKRQLQLSERFVQPNLMQQPDVIAGEHLSVPPQTPQQFDPTSGREATSIPTPRIEDRPRREKTRVALENWIGRADHDIVLGPAGAGKSTLLRFIALDMLSGSPKLVGRARRMPDFLPVWVSFAFWSKLIAGDKDQCSLIDAIEAWFRRQDEPDLIALTRKAYDDKRLLLLVDGIDEWENETAANTAFVLLQAFTERHAVPVIMTSRPHGFRLVTGLDGSWRISEIAPFTTNQQVALAQTWFAHLNTTGEDEQRIASRSLVQARVFISELQRGGAMAQLAAIPLLLTGLIALKVAQLALPRNRFLAYDALTKLLLELHPTARDKAALKGNPRHPLDFPTRETALAALAYEIHSGQDGTSADSIEIDRATAVVSRCLIQRVGMSAGDAIQAARDILTLGEEDIGILVKKSPREVGFFHRIFQEFLSSKHLVSMEFDEQLDLVGIWAVDPKWSDVILCLLHQLQRPAEIDRLLAKLESIDGDVATLAIRDVLLAEATFGEIRKSPQTAGRLADKAFEQIELGHWPSVRRDLVAHAIDGLSSPVLGPTVSAKLRQWFPKWHNYGLVEAFHAIADWPDDAGVQSTLWRGLHDEYFDAAQAAAQSIAKRFEGNINIGESLCRVIAAPPSIGAAAAAIEALSRGWPQHSKIDDILSVARKSDSRLVATAAIRGRVALRKHTPEDFELLTQFDESDDFAVNGLVIEAMIAGWAGDERLRAYALDETPIDSRRPFRHRRRNLGLLIKGFPGDRDVAALVASDLDDRYPLSFDNENLRSLAVHFKNNPALVAALEAWVMNHHPDDAYTLSYAARIAPTPILKASLLRCVEGDHLAFWAASALIDLWGAVDSEIQSALRASSTKPIEQRQNVAHVLPFVMTDKAECRRSLLEIVAANGRVRADFALQGLHKLGIDASDREATDCVLARGYDGERFVIENEARHLISTFYGDPRVVDLAKRQLQRGSGVIGAVASVFAHSAEMRRLVLAAAVPLELNMRLSILECLSRAPRDVADRALISAARHELAGEIVISASIKLAESNRETDQVSADYLTDTRRELDAIGPRMDARRQGATAALATVRRLDLLPKPDQMSSIRGIASHEHREMLRFVAMEWASIADGVGGEDAALAVLGVDRNDFFDVFGNDVSLSDAISAFALGLIENSPNGAPAPAIRLAEHARPGSGFLRELCLRSLNYKGHSNWESFSTALTAGEVLGRHFAPDRGLEDNLISNVNSNPRDSGSIMALCEGWPASERFLAMGPLFLGNEFPIPVSFRLTAVFSPSDRFVETLTWAANNLQGDLWEALPHWLPAIIRRLKIDDEAYGLMREMLFAQPSPAMKVSFPGILVRARTLDDDLRNWCRTECVKRKDVVVGEIGMDLIAGQQRLVAQSLFDLLSSRDV